MTNDQSAKHIAILLLFVICVGICGNTLSLIVFSKRNMRKISIFRFLFYLSVADLLVLLVCSTETLLKFGFHFEIRLYSSFLCTFHTFLANLLFHFSSIVLMVISIERASVICNKKLSSIFLKKKTNDALSAKDQIEKISLKKINTAEISSTGSLNGETTTTTDGFNILANYRFDFRARLRNFHKCECFRTVLSDKNGNSRISFISKINRIEMIMIIILIVLMIINSHYLFFVRLNQINQNNLLDKKPIFASSFNTSKSYKFVGLKINNNTTNSNIIKPNIKLANFSSFFNIKSQEKIKEQIKNQFDARKPINVKKGYICYPMNGTAYNYFLNHVWLWIDVWIYSLIPFAVMSTCSILILIEINRKTKRYLSYLDKETNKSSKIKTDKRLRRNKQLLFMLTSTNTFFILFSLLPYCVSFFKFKGDTSEAYLGQSFVVILSYINNAFNFLLYGLTSQKYREESAKILFPSDRLPSKDRPSTKILNGKVSQKLKSSQEKNKQSSNNINNKKDFLKENSKLLSDLRKSTISSSLKSLKLDFQSNHFDF